MFQVHNFKFGSPNVKCRRGAGGRCVEGGTVVLGQGFCGAIQQLGGSLMDSVLVSSSSPTAENIKLKSQWAPQPGCVVFENGCSKIKLNSTPVQENVYILGGDPNTLTSHFELSSHCILTTPFLHESLLLCVVPTRKGHVTCNTSHRTHPAS